MARSEEAQAFFHAVYSAVQEIPHGKVTSYGHIAKLVGTPQRPRQVGVCLKHLPVDPSARFNHENVPWQRVINAKGVISPRYVACHICLGWQVGCWFCLSKKLSWMEGGKDYLWIVVVREQKLTRGVHQDLNRRDHVARRRRWRLKV
ncbi:6-O-methylguanine DNA methyltransferase [Sordaria brevicollis]|uniref:6-O-methylguanine DNA methyltransferase n=1 Tax=Sordaria brevicollis TaxID=83679 RepID=A0AAE0UA96_SORBR|nr:6-O-methylguanine DNA methyltransferase [Sordaria brevicollis]